MPEQQNEEHFSRLEIQLYIVQDPWFQSQILRSVYISLKRFSSIKGRILQGIFEVVSFLETGGIKLPSQCCLTCLGE